MCFPIYLSSLDQKYLTQHVQSSTFLMWTGLKISGGEHCVTPARAAAKATKTKREWAKTDPDSDQVSSHDKPIVGESVQKITFHDHDSFRMVSHFSRMFAMRRASHLFFGGWGGLAKTEKQNLAQEKKEKKVVHNMGKRLCKSHLFWGFVQRDC